MTRKVMKTALSIAGTDPTGGAGIQADLKAMTMNGVFAMSVVTALVAQNTMGVKSIAEVEPEFLAQQIDAVFEDIVPDAVKIGMVFSCPMSTMHIAIVVNIDGFIFSKWNQIFAIAINQGIVGFITFYKAPNRIRHIKFLIFWVKELSYNKTAFFICQNILIFKG